MRVTALMLSAPAIVLIAVLAWALWVLPQLPDPVATRFGVDLAATDFTPPGTFIAIVAVTSVFTAVVFAVLLLTGVSSGSGGRVMAGVGAGSVILVPSVMAATLEPQIGLGDASAFHLPWPNMVAPFLVSAVAGAAVGLLVEPAPEPEAPMAADQPITVGPTSLAAWFGRSRAPWIMLVLFPTCVVASAIPSVLAFLGGSDVAGAGYAALTIALATGLSMLLDVRVRVDAAGVHWRLLPGFPRRTIPYSSIRDIEAVDVKPGDWGGWGYRISGKGTAILIRGGEGLRIVRIKGPTLYVTVDDAVRGAELARAHLRRR